MNVKLPADQSQSEVLLPNGDIYHKWDNFPGIYPLRLGICNLVQPFIASYGTEQMSPGVDFRFWVAVSLSAYNFTIFIQINVE